MRLPCEPPLDTSCILSNWLLLRFDLLRRRWLLPPFVRISLPPAVTRKRLAVALWVFSLYFLATMVIPDYSCFFSACDAEDLSARSGFSAFSPYSANGASIMVIV